MIEEAFPGKEPEWCVRWAYIGCFCYGSSDKHLHDSGDNKCLWLAGVYAAVIHPDNNEMLKPKMVWELKRVKKSAAGVV